MNAHHLLLLLSEETTNEASVGNNSRLLVTIILVLIVSITVYCLCKLISTYTNKTKNRVKKRGKND